ncbi:LuxR C-terminal-related transcriptional regulator [Parabacteroides sp. PF5-9]|uniref:LuxR C-terminal-related transcriptional regulator n=1 Tax=Parabacteroides sp. PF5-9 TaxID=1742404 RepID=UPI002474CD2E|nr:LuxR C-terminal-related transcriptional regulator [Parabacteroides sp. PF5-9]MDH6359026.1 DNA-binding NarL/FixJ family response regulator [Parabacteroides sp. PF5-9]
MNTQIKIAIAEPSAIIRTGMEQLLKRLHGWRIQLIEVTPADNLSDVLRQQTPDILIINPSLADCAHLPTLKEETGCQRMKNIAIMYSILDPAILRNYDEHINIYDSPDEIAHKLERLIEEHSQEETSEEQTLSAREKEIVVCVVKGMTNREIADSLFLSTHTVITHRRNIARKLQIHSASGLTIYAIVNKLVELSDIQ